MNSVVRKKILSMLGWYGTTAILLAFAAVSFGALRPTDVWYQILNATGATGLIIHEGAQRDYAPTILNVIWLVISIVALLQLLFGLFGFVSISTS